MTDNIAGTAAHLTTCWARLLMHSLWSAGVEHFVISPGSRSTPFTWAALQLSKSTLPGADDLPRAQCHVVLDERSAGFIALGAARNSGRPAVLLCTSGSAAANYFPAIVEARAAGIPMLVLTSDRPLELQYAGAAQTLDQIKLYGDQVLGFFELGAPDPSLLALRALGRMARQAFALSVGPVAGPVQLNARAKKPLEPEPEGALMATVEALLSSAAEPASAALASAPATGADRPGHHGSPTELVISPAAARALARRMQAAERGAILCGPLAPWQAARPETLDRVRELSGCALWCEATSNAVLADRGVGHITRFDTWLRDSSAREALWPDFALQLGPLPTSGALLRVLEARGLERHVWSPFGYQDPANSAASVLTLDLEASLQRLVLELEALNNAAPPPPTWAENEGGRRAGSASYAEQIQRVEAACAEAAALVARDAAEQLGEARAVAEVLAHLPKTCLLSVGNSLAVRELDWFRTGTMPTRVLSQRGLNGIDGIVSGALGAALTHDGPSAVLLGDLSLLHDVGSLGSAKLIQRSLVIVVINNAGGRIFEMLPMANQRSAAELEPWTTPHSARLSGAAQLFGVRYACAQRHQDIGPALSSALAAPEVTLLEVQVDPSSSIAAQRALWHEASTRIAALRFDSQGPNS